MGKVKESPPVDEWEDVEGSERLEWDEPKTVTGILVAVDDTTGQMGDNRIYRVQIGDKLFHFFGTTILNSVMLQIPIGSEVRIKYLGVSGRVKQFQVQKKKASVAF